MRQCQSKSATREAMGLIGGNTLDKLKHVWYAIFKTHLSASSSNKFRPLKRFRSMIEGLRVAAKVETALD